MWPERLAEGQEFYYLRHEREGGEGGEEGGRERRERGGDNFTLDNNISFTRDVPC